MVTAILPRFRASQQVPAFWVRACIGDSCGNDETSLGYVNRLSPESSPLNFRSLWWYQTLPCFAGLSGSASHLGGCRLFRGLPSDPPHNASRPLHYRSAIYFRHLTAYSGLSPVSRLRCQAHKTRPPLTGGVLAVAAQRQQRPYVVITVVIYVKASRQTGSRRVPQLLRRQTFRLSGRLDK